MNEPGRRVALGVRWEVEMEMRSITGVESPQTVTFGRWLPSAKPITTLVRFSVLFLSKLAA